MRIRINIKTGKKEQKVIKKNDSEFEVWVKARPIRGAANKELIQVLARHFKIKITEVSLISGLRGKNKMLEINN